MSSLHILLAEDESLIRLGLKHILEEAGHIVYAAEDGLAALQLAEARTPDLAVLDIKMPRMDGLETAARLYERAPIPIIFLTAFAEKELVERAAKLPVMGYLIKPLKEAELLAMIAVATRRFQEHARVASDAATASAELEATRLLDRAKGLVMQASDCSELDAYEQLRHRADAERRPLTEIARDVIAEFEG
ncbi:MAG: hypothetical protein A2289_21515 [Deltaproteobacteria bacterium RIFOXYA12_FULL_58_15]|nr:MAG: hypothetical protein A2289_21515 [Deltaproteobacteria bacterium RIFOXYA12_FULL_58_15]OGR11879.1 MAG: hypothetical protein A2341_17065 [Deltaproteobacteria bacterium RIFOXYB12_FULL_58_9]